MKRILTIGFFLITGCILTHSELSLQYAFMGLELWFHKMIPTLVPFMILSGIMVRMELTEGFTLFVYPFIKPLFQVSANVCYAMIMGFLCGFPMGAKTISDLYSQGLISKREAEYLLAFCNNIGPVYFIGFVLPLLQRKLLLPYLLGMYGLPLLYGLFLRYTYYKDIPLLNALPTQSPNSGKPKQEHGLFLELDNTITQTLQSILSLGGYMIFFNMLNLIPHILFHKSPVYLAPLLEISGGLRLLQDSCPLYVLLLLPFGGLSCIAQTYSCIKNTPLSLANYTLHKLILTAFTLGYYLLWFLLFSNSFMR
ncbi:MAG: hypothetical protein J6A94_12370 [Lachnospiraceae bacterium]|nr:hypothetical protein [Lachnospiraceae bacterium]